MTDKHANIRAALEASKSDNWIFAKYGPKTFGVGIAGGPALMMARPSDVTDADEVKQLLNELLLARKAVRPLLEDCDELEALFNMRYQADLRAISMWRAAGDDREMKLPDRADLCLFLLEREDFLLSTLNELIDAIDGNFSGNDDDSEETLMTALNAAKNLIRTTRKWQT
ncbi:hypothetical protein [Neopusillimonas aromaticivorans]|uniref:hypothetical protein n=1 Tax=Neopusillimonas aromaticivorans TaxID=2979868 RepID=UPI002598156E|nr:hypothetical protein [Neopusillimonas aromaticivorans]WJJ94026.1 hypothetical protein N7E01_02270 [Neopusillimonas aromaticivorans]